LALGEQISYETRGTAVLKIVVVERFNNTQLNFKNLKAFNFN